jgi:hypothetical protein
MEGLMTAVEHRPKIVPDGEVGIATVSGVTAQQKNARQRAFGVPHAVEGDLHPFFSSTSMTRCTLRA